MWSAFSPPFKSSCYSHVSWDTLYPWNRIYQRLCVYFSVFIYIFLSSEFIICFSDIVSVFGYNFCFPDILSIFRIYILCFPDMFSVFRIHFMLSGYIFCFPDIFYVFRIYFVFSGYILWFLDIFSVFRKYFLFSGYIFCFPEIFSVFRIYFLFSGYIFGYIPRFPVNNKPRKCEDLTNLCQRWSKNGACALDKSFVTR